MSKVNRIKMRNKHLTYYILLYVLSCVSCVRNIVVALFETYFFFTQKSYFHLEGDGRVRFYDRCDFFEIVCLIERRCSWQLAIDFSSTCYSREPLTVQSQPARRIINTPSRSFSLANGRNQARRTIKSSIWCKMR